MSDNDGNSLFEAQPTMTPGCSKQVPASILTTASSNDQRNTLMTSFFLRRSYLTCILETNNCADHTRRNLSYTLLAKQLFAQGQHE